MVYVVTVFITFLSSGIIWLVFSVSRTVVVVLLRCFITCLSDDFRGLLCLIAAVMMILLQYYSNFYYITYNIYLYLGPLVLYNVVIFSSFCFSVHSS